MYSHSNNLFSSELEPSEFYLSPNYPNPFKEKTVIKYCVGIRARVILTVFDADGNAIEKLVDEEQNPGTYEVKFNASVDHYGVLRNLSDGYYFYRLEAGDFINEKKWFCINGLL